MASGRRGKPRTAPIQVDPTNFMGTLREMAYMMLEQAATTHQMMDQLGRQPKADHGGNPNGLGVDLEYLKVVEFRGRTHPVLEELLIPTRLIGGLRQ